MAHIADMVKNLTGIEKLLTNLVVGKNLQVVVMLLLMCVSQFLLFLNILVWLAF
jgi:hypothetical protein